jgi:DNA-binding NarL/FixJ family response regulator
MTRVLVAAPSAVVRAGLEAILARDPSLVVVGSAISPRSLVDDVTEHEPDVVLLDAGNVDIEELVSALPLLSVDADDGAHATPRIVLLTDEREPSRVADALHGGVRGLLSREALPNEILTAIGAAAAGLVVLSPEWLDPIAPSRPAASHAASTSHPAEVLRMIADGLANKQIAARLGISEHTVKFHVASIFAKLHASTRAEAVVVGARLGMIVV